MGDDLLYTPINTVKPVAEGLWIVDGPEIGFGVGPFKMPFSTRMTVIRRADGKLVLHSPTALTDELKAQIDVLGEVADLVAPNKIHYWWVRDWKDAYPSARVLAAPGVGERAGDRLPSVDQELDGSEVEDWGDVLSYIPVTGGFMTEAVVFHHPSRTLVLTDLIENFEPHKVPSWWLRILMKLGGILHPHGSMPRDMRLTFRGREPHLRTCVQQMMALEPARIIMAHGKLYEADCRAELARAFNWLNVGD